MHWGDKIGGPLASRSRKTNSFRQLNFQIRPALLPFPVFMKSDRIMGPTFNRRETLGLPLGAERESVGRRRQRERGKNRKVPACLPDCLPDCLSHHIVNSQDRPPPPRRVRSSDGLDRDRRFPEPCHRVARCCRRHRRLLLFHACRSTHKLSHLYSRERRVDWRVTWRRRRTRSSAEMQRHSPRTDSSAECRISQKYSPHPNGRKAIRAITDRLPLPRW